MNDLVERALSRAAVLEETARRAELLGCTRQAERDRAVAAELRRLVEPPPPPPPAPPPRVERYEPQPHLEYVARGKLGLVWR